MEKGSQIGVPLLTREYSTIVYYTLPYPVDPFPAESQLSHEWKFSADTVVGRVDVEL